MLLSSTREQQSWRKRLQNSSLSYRASTFLRLGPPPPQQRELGDPMLYPAHTSWGRMLTVAAVDSGWPAATPCQQASGPLGAGLSSDCPGAQAWLASGDSRPPNSHFFWAHAHPFRSLCSLCSRVLFSLYATLPCSFPCLHFR